MTAVASSPPTLSDLESRRRYSITAFGKVVGADPSTCHRWITSGLKGVLLPCHTVGGKRIIYEDEGNAFLAAVAQATEAAPPRTQRALDARTRQAGDAK